MSPEIVELILSLQSVKEKTFQSLLNVIGCNIKTTTNIDFFKRLMEFKRILHGNKGLYSKTASTPGIMEYVMSEGNTASEADCRAVAQALRILFNNDFLSRLFNIVQTDQTVHCLVIDDVMQFIEFDLLSVTPGHSIVNPNGDKIFVSNFYLLKVYSRYMVFLTYNRYLWHEALSHFNVKPNIVESLGSLLGLPYTYNISQFYQNLKNFLQLYGMPISSAMEHDKIIEAVKRHSALNNIKMNINLVAKLLVEILHSVEFMNVLEQNFQTFDLYLRIDSPTINQVIKEPIESMTIDPNKVVVTYSSGDISTIRDYNEISYNINAYF